MRLTNSTLLMTLFFAASTSFAQSHPPGPSSVENIRFWVERTSVRIVVDIDGQVELRKGELQGPSRFFVDISPARLSSTLKGKEWAVPSQPLQRIRVAQYDASTVRVVLDGVDMRSVTSSTISNPTRLVLDVATSVSADPRNSVSRLGLSNPYGGPVPAKVDFKGSTVTMAANDTATRGVNSFRIVIDPGHGGHDKGSIGPTGLMEKDLVLDVARRLAALLQSEMAAEVVMTRSGDTFIPLEIRTEKANQANADLFISIHANASKVKTVRGVETYFLNYNTESRESLETASRENASATLGIHELHQVVKKIMLNDKIEESRDLAQRVQTAMSKQMRPGSDRGVKQAPFIVLVGATMPSILAEIGYLSNAEDERNAKTESYRQQLAESLFRGIRSYTDSLIGRKTVQSKAH